MNHTVTITLAHRSLTRKLLGSILAECDMSPRDGEYIPLLNSFEVVLRGEDQRIGRLIETSRQRIPEVAHFVAHGVEYDRDDIARSTMCELRLACRPAGKPVHHFGTKYDLDTPCRGCRSLGYQTGPLRHPFGLIRSRARFLLMSDGEKLVRQDVAGAIDSLIGDRGDLCQAVDSEANQPVPWWQILPRFTMPPMDWEASAMDVSRVCRLCKRSGFQHDEKAGRLFPVPPPTYRLPTLEMERLPDFGASWELFGASPDALGQCRALFVSRRVALLLLDMRVNSLHLVPVRFLT